MYTDYRKVLDYLKRLNVYSLSKYNLNLCDITVSDNKSVLEVLYSDSDYAHRYVKFRKEWGELLYPDKSADTSNLVATYFPDVNINRSIMEMSEDDLMNVINLTRSSQLGNFLLIRYNEIRIYDNKLVTKPYKVYDGILQEMRSIIVNIRDFSLVSLPFYKFMNMGECEEYSYETIMNRLSNANLVEYSNKLDGSFIQITSLDKQYPNYPYTEVLSSSRNLSDTQIVSGARKWYESHSNYQTLVRAYPEYTLMFEWISMSDKHIVVYLKEQTGLYLIGMRHKVTGELLPYQVIQEIAKNYQVKSTVTYSGGFEDIQRSLSSYKSSEKEGYVINIDGFLVKLKCEDYLNMVALLNETSSSNLVIKCISNNSLDDLLSRVPEGYKESILRDAESVYSYMTKMDAIINSSVEYLVNNVEFKSVSKVLKRMPKIFKICISGKYYSLVKEGKAVELNYLTMGSSRGSQGYINMTELYRRLKLIDEFDIRKYIINS
jgi:hypothetical protein